MPIVLTHLSCPSTLRKRRVWMGIVLFLAVLSFLAYLSHSFPANYKSSRETNIRPKRVKRTKPRTTQAVEYATRALARPLRQPARPLKVSEEHTWHGDGLLRVNPDGTHPIPQLIQRAESRWAQKQRRASKSMEEAVSQYQRRYKRPPPQGFEHWWKYAIKHKVQLPDEYDQISADLEPYWGLDPILLERMANETEEVDDAFTIGKVKASDKVTLLNLSPRNQESFHTILAQASAQIDLIQDVGLWLPPFKATFSIHGKPTQLSNWRLKKAALDAASKGISLNSAEFTQVTEGWATTCPPNVAHLLNPAVPSRPTSQQKRFIFNHRSSMDACSHSEHLGMHSQYISDAVEGVQTQFARPLFSTCISSLHGGIHVPTVLTADETVKYDYKWEDKFDDRLSWRGSPRGAPLFADTFWMRDHRIRLANTTNPFIYDNRNASVLLPSQSDKRRVGVGTEVLMQELNMGLVDVAFSEGFQDCEGETCKALDSLFRIHSQRPIEEEKDCKYILDIDEIGCSRRFRRLMSMNSAIFKSTIYPEWYMDRIEPWVHYIPMQLDYSDMYDILIFFGGDLTGYGDHEDLARKIGVAGREWTEHFWRREDLTAYMFRLYLEFARVMSPNRDQMSYSSNSSSAPMQTGRH